MGKEARGRLKPGGGRAPETSRSPTARRPVAAPKAPGRSSAKRAGTVAKGARQTGPRRAVSEGKRVSPGKVSKSHQVLQQLAKMAASDVAVLFGVTPQAVGKWHSKEGCPRNKDGTFDLAEVIRWRVKKVAPEWKPLDRYRTARAEAEEIRTALMRGTLCRVDERDALDLARVRCLVATLKPLGRLMSPILAALESEREIQTLIDERVQDAIQEFTGDREIPEDDDVARYWVERLKWR